MVSLEQYTNQKVKVFSGGMKRRLQLTISALGDPKLLIFDEPTTGMDPICKKEVWNLIQYLKPGKVIIMATHSMEEAELLSDRIAILKKGELSFIGMPSALKEKYQQKISFLFKINLKATEKEIIINKIIELLPQSEILNQVGPKLDLNVSQVEKIKLIQFFEILEKNKEREFNEAEIKLQDSILDYGLAYCTLEEIFSQLSSFY
eukprot:TRINITY_DN3530_c0_g1_i4.p2 TRINITY_DN3530_c0_g1~~TRINITY_DN3530_c0_g1_i4.p2  ORF type:complete len:205 (-),score=49.64 TRINITY_DN3530_c0_g1_i4:165-779(-)